MWISYIILSLLVIGQWIKIIKMQKNSDKLWELFTRIIELKNEEIRQLKIELINKMGKDGLASYDIKRG